MSHYVINTLGITSGLQEYLWSLERDLDVDPLPSFQPALRDYRRHSVAASVDNCVNK